MKVHHKYVPGTLSHYKHPACTFFNPKEKDKAETLIIAALVLFYSLPF